MYALIVIFLVLLGLFLMVAEILILPGITVAAFASVCSFLASLYLSYVYFGITGFVITFVVALGLSVWTLIVCTKRKNLKKISLEEKIDSQVAVNAEGLVAIGDRGYAKTRLAPMGSVVIGDRQFEGKSFDGYIVQQEPVEIVGFEDHIVIVKKINNK